MTLATAAIISSVAGAGMQVYSASQQAKTAERAAKFNAEQTRNAAKAKAGDARENALRKQEEHRKYLGNLRAKMFAKGDTIEGGDADFLSETEGNLQLRIMDQSVANQREQAGFANQAFRYDAAADQARSAGGINTISSALSGFNSVYTTGMTAGKWGQPKKDPNAKSKSPIVA